VAKSRGAESCRARAKLQGRVGIHVRGGYQEGRVSGGGRGRRNPSGLPAGACGVEQAGLPKGQGASPKPRSPSGRGMFFLHSARLAESPSHS
jgi:hypothetical protein